MTTLGSFSHCIGRIPVLFAVYVLGCSCLECPTPDVLLQLIPSSRLILPNDSHYEQARIAENERYNHTFPCAIISCETAQHVSAALLLTQQLSLPFSVRSGGHSYEGFSLSDGIIIDLSAMNQTHVHLENSTVSIGPGATLMSVYAALQPSNHVLPGGSCPTVGVAGFTLGGGHGLLGRQLGLMSDSLSSVELVLASGETIRASGTGDHSELFWGLQGSGGGNFGVVTALEFKLHSLPPSGNVTTYVAVWDIKHAGVVTDSWQRWLQSSLDPRISSKLTWHTTDLTAVGVFLADGTSARDELTRILQPLLQAAPIKKDLDIRTWPWLHDGRASAAFMLAGCDGVWACENSGKAAWKGKSGYPAARTGLSAEAIRTVEEWMFIRSLNSSHAYAGAMFDAYGGRIATHQGGSFPHREAPFSIQMLEYWFQGHDDPQQSLVWVREFAESLSPYLSGAAYVNYIDLDLGTHDTQGDYERAYYQESTKRLRRVKQIYDPNDVFHFAQSITRDGANYSK